MSAPDGGDAHARLKALFGEVCDLPTRAQALARLQALQATPAECDRVLQLLAHDDGRTTHLSGPVTQMVSSAAGGELRPGDRLGAWTLVGELGQGGMGRVFEARRSDGHYEQRSAIKVLRGFSGEAALQQLAHERQVLATLNHPHIARLLDGGTTPGGSPYLVMEHVHGVRIDEHVRQRGLSLEKVLELFLMVCDAVAYAHRHFVVHCDIKPGNVLVDDEGRAKLLDFGIAQLQGRAGSELQGLTPRYASPEQRAGAPATAASDIYSLGRLLAELLPPTHGPRHGGPRRELQAVIDCATAELPEARYADVAALVAELHRLRRHEPLAALRQRRPYWPYAARKFLRRHWAWTLAGVGVVALSTGFTLSVIRERDAAEAARAQAQREAEAKGQVSAFVLSMFRAGDPGSSGHPDLTASQLLAQGRARIDGELRGQPLLQSELKSVLAAVYDNIGQPQAAIELYDEALRIERTLQPQRLSHQTDLLSELALALSDDGQKLRALKVGREALAVLGQRPDAPALEVANVLSHVGWIEAGADEFDEGRRHLLQALQLRAQWLGHAHRNTAVTHHNLGQLEVRAGQFVQAEQHLRKALTTLEALKDLPAPVLLTTREAWAVSLVHLQRADEAAPVQTDTVAQRRRLHGEGSAVLARSLNELSTVLRGAGRPREALAAVDEAIAINRARHPRSPNLVRNLNNRGLALEDLGDPAAGQAFAELAALRATLPDLDGNARSQSDFFYGRWLSRSGRLQEALPLLASAADYRRRAMPPAHVDRVESELELAELQRRRGAVSDAAAPAEAAGAALPALEAGSVPPRLHILASRVRALQAARQPASAAEVAAHMSTALGLAPPRHAEALRLRIALAEALFAAGDTAACRSTLADAQPGLAAQHPASPWRARAERLQAQLSDARKP